MACFAMLELRFCLSKILTLSSSLIMAGDDLPFFSHVIRRMAQDLLG